LAGGAKTGGAGMKEGLSIAGGMGGAWATRTHGATTGELVGGGLGVSTLRDVAGAGVGWLGLVVLCRMSISCCKALEWLSLKGARGKFGEGKWSAWMILAMLALM